MTRARQFLWMIGNIQSLISLGGEFKNLIEFFASPQNADYYHEFDSSSCWRDRDALHERLFSQFKMIGARMNSESIDENLKERLEKMGQREGPKLLEKAGLIRAKKRDFTEFISGGYRRKDAEGGQYFLRQAAGNTRFGSRGIGGGARSSAGPSLSGLPQHLTAILRANRAQRFDRGRYRRGFGGGRGGFRGQRFQQFQGPRSAQSSFGSSAFNQRMMNSSGPQSADSMVRFASQRSGSMRSE